MVKIIMKKIIEDGKNYYYLLLLLLLWFNIIIKHKQDYFQNSYFVRTAKLWNNLPTELKAINSLCAFKSCLNKLYTRKTKSYKLPNNHT